MISNSSQNQDNNPTEKLLDDLLFQVLGGCEVPKAATIDSDTLIQYNIIDTYRIQHASDSELTGVLSGIKNRFDDNDHPQMKALYSGTISFLEIIFKQTQTIERMQQEMTSITAGNQQGEQVQTDQIANVRNVMTDILSLQEDIKAEVVSPEQKLEFVYGEVSCYVTNMKRDKIFRYWYINRRRHCSQNLSNRQIAKEMEEEMNIDMEYSAKIISHIHRWFTEETSSTWLSGDYIMRTQMLFSYRGYSNLQLNYCHQPPSRQQIITLGQQLQVNTRQQEEE